MKSVFNENKIVSLFSTCKQKKDSSPFSKIPGFTTVARKKFKFFKINYYIGGKSLISQRDKIEKLFT